MFTIVQMLWYMVFCYQTIAVVLLQLTSIVIVAGSAIDWLQSTNTRSLTPTSVFYALPSLCTRLRHCCHCLLRQYGTKRHSVINNNCRAMLFTAISTSLCMRSFPNVTVASYSYSDVAHKWYTRPRVLRILKLSETFVLSCAGYHYC